MSNSKIDTIKNNVRKVYESGLKPTWRAIQQGGNRTNYIGAFANAYWDDDTYNPQYDFHIDTNNNASDMFANSLITDTKRTFLVTAAYGLNMTFRDATHLKVIRYLNFMQDLVAQTLFRTFDNCISLEEIYVTGYVLGDFDFKSCPLTVDCMKRFISSMVKNPTYKYTLTFSSTCWEALEASGPAPDGGTWADYVESLGWLIG